MLPVLELCSCDVYFVTYPPDRVTADPGLPCVRSQQPVRLRRVHDPEEPKSLPRCVIWLCFTTLPRLLAYVQVEAEF